VDAPAARTLALAGGRSLRVAEAGRGPPVVLIHGTLSALEDMWLAPFAERLAERFRVISLDRPGHGLSTRRRFEAAPARQAELIADALAQLGVERPVLVSHSGGALVALAGAAAAPEAVAGLVLVGPLGRAEVRPLEHGVLAPRATPLVGPWWSQLAEASTDPAMLSVLRRGMFAPQPVPERWLREFPERLVLESMVANGEDAAVLLTPAAVVDVTRISAPVRVLYGGEDRVADPRLHAIPLAAALPLAETERLDGLGHMAHHFATEAMVAAVEAVAG
jgi:pimeloyl-ACP methyl ester carboxylesterase